VLQLFSASDFPECKDPSTSSVALKESDTLQKIVSLLLKLHGKWSGSHKQNNPRRFLTIYRHLDRELSPVVKVLIF